MTGIVQQVKRASANAIRELYSIDIQEDSVLVNATKPEFEGDYTVVLFAFIKLLKTSPEALGQALGKRMVEQNPQLFSSFNVIKGFLNLVITDSYWISFLQEQAANPDYGIQPRRNEKVMVEYSSPNTNKPLHLGHLRNNFLGWSLAAILEANGYDIVKTCIVNDRGIHICKSMLAWEMFADGATPASTGIKGDHFVGDYYVKFNNVYKEEVRVLVEGGMKEEEAEKEAPVLKAAQQMLQRWEAGDPAVLDLWRRMNEWVYEGFDITYRRIGSDFDKKYYESNTYLLGKKIVEQGLKKNVFFKKEDGSVWIDLTPDGLDEKVVMRRDGTSVYITQDIGLAEQKQEEFHANQSIYVVGDEQNYHFKVLKLICEKLQLPSAENIFHLSYGMVELPSGKMKSREGTVVDADDLLDEMVAISQQKTEELGKVKDFTGDELAALYDTLGLGALKFFLLRVDPKKRMIFHPEESIDFHGFTGPFVQYTYARIRSVIRKIGDAASAVPFGPEAESLLPLERELVLHLEQFPVLLQEAGAEHDPSKLALYLFVLARIFNSFYTAHSIAQAETEGKKQLRIRLAEMTASVIKTGMRLLGIGVPERM